ncbi:arginine deiminase family protein [Streptomyces sp. NPDC005899]|uniref:arginine deiminase family protein n=1 Tax=Streptomyces sp. NPDC005899 TaxID=3155716 RepID=UPI0033E6FB96
MPPTRFLLQDPTEVMPAEMGLFMDAERPYDPSRVRAESEALREVLSGFGDVVTVRRALEAIPREELLALAQEAVAAPTSDRLKSAWEALDGWTATDLAEMVVRRPRLELHEDPEIALISPDCSYESYVTRPLFGLMFPRDHYVDLGGPVALARLRRRDRARETDVLEKVLRALRGRAADHVPADGLFLEGGDVATAESLAVVGCGFRTSPEAAGALVPLLASGGRQVLEVRDGVRSPGAFHLDHWFSLGPGLALVARDRLDDPRVVATVHPAEQDRPSGPSSPLTLREALECTGTSVLALTPEEVEGFAANVFFVPGKRSVIVSEAAHDPVARLLDPHGFEISTVPFDAHHQQFGSVHCAVNTLAPADVASPIQEDTT